MLGPGLRFAANIEEVALISSRPESPMFPGRPGQKQKCAKTRFY